MTSGNPVGAVEIVAEGGVGGRVMGGGHNRRRGLEACACRRVTRSCSRRQVREYG